MHGWLVWIDRGGTFTDFVAVSPIGQVRVKKMLSATQDGHDVVAKGIREVGGDTCAVAELRVGTTLATNALLERKGARVGLITTIGFRDVLEIRYQNRPYIYKLRIDKTLPLYQSVVEIQERVAADGKITIPLDPEIVRLELTRFKELGVTSLAVSLMNAYRNPVHELVVEEIAQELGGFGCISLSHRVSPRIRYIARTETTTIDAYLTPVLRNYSTRLRQTVKTDSLLFMQSWGGLRPAHDFRGHSALLSGPAGGVVGAGKICAENGIDRAITFDMGGTSTDIALYDGDYQMRHEGLFKGFLLQTPRIAIHTIASGGGSILALDQGRQLVGPESAGAVPGPVCYRNDGQHLTVTDANLFLGRIQKNFFPAIFGPKQNLALDTETITARFQALAAQQGCDPYQLAWGFIDIAVEKMSLAVRQVCIESGYDAKHFTLFCFGGAGAQLICQVADRLGIARVIVHPLASVLSALGIGLAGETTRETRRLHKPLTGLKQEELDTICASLQAKVPPSSTPRHDVFILEMRCRDSDHIIDVKETRLVAIDAEFRTRYRNLFGVIPSGDLMIENITLEARLQRSYLQHVFPAMAGEKQSPETATLYQVERQDFVCVPIHRSTGMGAGDKIAGPAIIADDFTTIVIDAGWQGKFSPQTGWNLERIKQVKRSGTRIASTVLEVFYQKVHAIAEEMGFVLKHAAHSVVIKERLDYSCAIFAANGELLTSAPHIPVHLGSMGECVKYLVQNVAKQDLRDGDAWITNHPLQGGTHLPDITIITPVFIDKELVFFVASRGHHADIGGIAPGSMPGRSRKLEEDGVVISLQKIVENYVFREKEITAVLSKGPYPVRNLAQNMHDLKAQLAANTRGKQGMQKLVSLLGLGTALSLAEELLCYTTAKIHQTLMKFPDRQARIDMDQGRWITVRFAKRGKGKFLLDFSSTCVADTGNFNAPPAVVKSACLFVLRCLLDSDVPLNDGLGRALEIVLPPNSIVNPPPDAAVVAGNVETSQSICDLLFEIFAACAHAQGTMSNFSMGNADYQYYETIGGGSGAGASFAGCDATQVHMTNSRITDPEILELLYPLTVVNNGIRRGSGGIGKLRGGDGIYRRLEFLQDMEANILSQRRATRPLGLHGGGRGQAGRNIWSKKISGDEVLSGVVSVDVNRGDWITIETPGGGGYSKQQKEFAHLYFAYGNDLDPCQINCPGAFFRGRARLLKHELRLQKDGMVRVEKKKAACVWGGLHALTTTEFAILRTLRQSLHRAQALLDDGQEVTVWFCSVQAKSVSAVASRWHIYRSAYLLNAPMHYLKLLASWGTDDPL